MPAHESLALQTRAVESPDGLRLTVDFAGDANAPAVILLHGGGQTRHAWRGATRALAARGYHVAATDLRGHGESGWSETLHYTIAAQVNDVRAIAQQMQGPVALIGASMGGQIALCTAAAHPEDVRALVLVDMTPQVDRVGRAKILDFMRHRPDGFGSLDEAADAIADYLPHRPRPSDLSGLRRNLRLGPDQRYRWHWDPRFLLPYEPDADEAEQRYSAAARRITAPTLLLRGAQSELITPENVRHFQQLIPHADYVDIADAAHMIAGDRNDIFNAEVIAFLDRHRR